MSQSIIVPLGEVRAQDDQGVGSRYVDKEGRKYKWVLYATQTATLVGAKGDALGYDDGDTTLNTVGSDESDCLNLVPAGVIPNQTGFDTPIDGEYFWMQYYGICTLAHTPTGTTPAAGDTIGLGTTDETFMIDPADTQPRAGWLINTTTLAFIDCSS